MRNYILSLLSVFLLAACGKNVITMEPKSGYTLILQTRGPVLGYTSAPILTVDGYAFKDLNRNGGLDVYEDWRKDAKTRARDLASQLTLEEICGLMLYSSAVDANDTVLDDKARRLLADDHIRHMLVRNVATPAVGAGWSNAVQAFCESARLGIPSNNSTDPRNYSNGTTNINNYKPEQDGEFDPAGESD